MSTVVGWLKQAWEWVNKLLGPIDESGAKWKGWGEAAGTAAASVVTALSALPGKIKTLTKEAYDAFVNFDWGAAGLAIVNGIAGGITGAAGKLADAAKAAASGAVEAVKYVIGLGGGSSSSSAPSGGTKVPGAPPLAGARAMGGPVNRGLSYLVGERGPEIFTPGAAGQISTNGTLNRLAELGSRAKAAEDGGTSQSLAPSAALVAMLRPQAGNVSTRGDTHYSPSFAIHGANDVAAVKREVETHFFDLVSRHENDQRGLLSD